MPLLFWYSFLASGLNRSMKPAVKPEINPPMFEKLLMSGIRPRMMFSNKIVAKAMRVANCTLTEEMPLVYAKMRSVNK